MMEYVKFFPERLQYCREAIEKARTQGTEDDVRMVYEGIGRVFVAAMGYAFEDVTPDFPLFSFADGEWRAWRADIDRSEAKRVQMQELGRRGGAASGASRNKGKVPEVEGQNS